jgi:hypothetical protein
MGNARPLLEIREARITQCQYHLVIYDIIVCPILKDYPGNFFNPYLKINVAYAVRSDGVGGSTEIPSWFNVVKFNRTRTSIQKLDWHIGITRLKRSRTCEVESIAKTEVESDQEVHDTD